MRAGRRRFGWHEEEGVGSLLEDPIEFPPQMEVDLVLLVLPAHPGPGRGVQLDVISQPGVRRIGDEGVDARGVERLDQVGRVSTGDDADRLPLHGRVKPGPDAAEVPPQVLVDPGPDGVLLGCRQVRVQVLEMNPLPPPKELADRLNERHGRSVHVSPGTLHLPSRILPWPLHLGHFTMPSGSSPPHPQW